MSSHFEENARSWGPEGIEWFNNIPNLVAAYQKKWDLKISSPFTLNYNYVAPAECADGTQAVLKIGFPKNKEFQTEINALKVFNGDSIIRLLEADRENAVILIERVMPGTPLSTLEDDEKATRIIASVIKGLHKPLPPDHTFPTIKEWSSAIPELRKKFKGTAGPLPANLVDRAEELFEELITSSAAPVLVHGDLHQDNILYSENSGWIAIDPKGVAAEPAYEAAAMIRNPYEKLKNVDDLKPILRRRIEILSEELEIDPGRIHGWCLAQTVLSAVWSADGPKGWQHAIKVAEALSGMKY